MASKKIDKKIKDIVIKYAEELKKNNFSFEAIYLFGSYAKKRANRWSDIDLAVVSDQFKRNSIEKELFLWKIGRKIDSKIEPIGFSVEDFNDFYNPIVYEIKTTGVRVM
jgi:predicted nucleotidyltransferase